MKPPRRSRYTALAGAVALALLAATWLGADDEAAPPSAPKRPRAAPGASTALAAPVASAAAARPATRELKVQPPDRDAALAALDTTLVAQRVAPDAAAANAFAAKSWFIAPPPAPPQPEAPPPPPPAPQAPPLPFKYMGSLQESGARTIWYLLQGERLIVAGAGDVIDTVYRTDGADGGQLRFTYLPLNQRQTLSIGVPP